MPISVTETSSRRRIALIVALTMLVVPAFLASSSASAQRGRASATPTPKKKTTPTPKKTQAKTKPTPTPKNTKADPKKSTAKKTDPKKPDPKKNDPRKTDKSTAKTGRTNDKTKTSDKSKPADKNAKSTKTTNSKPSTSAKKTTTDSRSKPTTTRQVEPKASTTKTGSTTSAAVKKTPTPATPKTEKPASTDAPKVIAATYSVPIRSDARTDASAVAKVKLGTVMTVVDKTPAWYKVQYSAGGKTTTGWVSANATGDLNAGKKSDIYAQIAERNYDPQMDFTKAAEFCDFVSHAELDTSDRSADLELKRLLAMRSALKSISLEKRESEPYRGFLKNQDKEIVYNEPAGQYVVAANSFWTLHDKYKKSPVSDRIAWEAANNPLPGECEGYVNCYLFDMRMRFGEYLNQHPTGKNASEALRNLNAYLSPIVADAETKQVYNGPTDVTDRAEFNNLIAELRTIVARLSFVEKDKTLAQLKTIAEAFR